LIYEGYVDDFEEFMARMDIGAFPVFTGSTIKGKIVESLCRAFPSVLTKNCLGMYDLKDGREVIIRNISQIS